MHQYLMKLMINDIVMIRNYTVNAFYFIMLYIYYIYYIYIYIICVYVCVQKIYVARYIFELISERNVEF